MPLSALSTAVKSKNHGTLTFTVPGTTGAPTTPVSLVGQFDKGDFSFDGAQAELNAMSPVFRRGAVVDATNGDPELITGSFSGIMNEFSDTATGTLASFALKQEPFTDNLSSMGAGRPYMMDITWTVEGTDLGDDADSEIVFHDCRVVIGGEEGDPSNNFNFSFTCLGGVTGDWSLVSG